MAVPMATRLVADDRRARATSASGTGLAAATWPPTQSESMGNRSSCWIRSTSWGAIRPKRRSPGAATRSACGAGAQGAPAKLPQPVGHRLARLVQAGAVVVVEYGHGQLGHEPGRVLRVGWVDQSGLGR